MKGIWIFLFSLLPGLVLVESGSAIEVQWIYEDGGDSSWGVILCHGRGGDPESYVVDPLRLELNELLGVHTLSLQMPGGRKELPDYKDDFPEAHMRIEKAIEYLRGRGVRSFVLIGHSLGSRMATSYLAANPSSPITLFVGVGMLNNGEPPLNCLENLRDVRIPVLDIWGTAGRAGDNNYGLERRVLRSSRYQQHAVAGGDHALSDHEDELVQVVADWLSSNN